MDMSPNLVVKSNYTILGIVKKLDFVDKDMNMRLTEDVNRYRTHR